MLYKDAMAKLESLKEEDSLTGKEAAELLEAFRSNQKSLNQEAETSRKEAESFKSELESQKSLLGKISDHLKLDVRSDIDSQLTKISEKSNEATKKMTDFERMQQEFADLKQGFESVKTENESLKTGILQKQKDVIKASARGKILEGFLDGNFIDDPEMRETFADKLLNMGAFTEDSESYTIDGKDPKEYAKTYVEERVNLQQSRLVERPQGTVQSVNQKNNGLATGIVADVMAELASANN